MKSPPFFRISSHSWRGFFAKTSSKIATAASAFFARVRRVVLDVDTGIFHSGLEFDGITIVERTALRYALRGIPPRFPSKLIAV